MRPKDEDKAEGDKYHGHKGGKSWHVGKGCAGGEEHNKWILGLINMGSPRKDGQQDYNWNLFNMSAQVFMCCELKEPERELLLNEPEAWVPPAHSVSVQEPPQGFYVYGAVKR